MPLKTSGRYENRERLADAVWLWRNDGDHPNVIAVKTGVSERTVRRIIATGEGKHDKRLPDSAPLVRTTPKRRRFTAVAAFFAGFAAAAAVLAAVPAGNTCQSAPAVTGVAIEVPSE